MAVAIPVFSSLHTALQHAVSYTTLTQFGARCQTLTSAVLQLATPNPNGCTISLLQMGLGGQVCKLNRERCIAGNVDQRMWC